MANLTIAQLTQILAAGVDNADLLPLWDDTAQETKKITIAQFKTLIGAVESVGATSPIASSGGKTPTISISQSGAATDGYLSSTDWNTFNGKQGAITLTTTGSSGAATFIGNTLNIPNYSFSLVNWSEGFSSATQATSQWTPLNAAANVNAAITPKGTGALVAQIPTGTTVGGNARGTYSVDFQMGRNNANQVASGNYSVIAGGINNRVSGNNSFVGAGASLVASGGSSGVVSGTSNTASGGNSFIGGGQSSTASGADSFIGGGNTNTVSGQYGTIGGGLQNTVSNTYATVAGGWQNTASADRSFVGGGHFNQSNGQLSIIGAGYNNVASGTYDVIVGGYQNFTSFTGTGNESHRFIGGGETNIIGPFQNDHTVIVGGLSNTIYGFTAFAFIGAGRLNNVCGVRSIIVGGDTNRIGNGAVSTGNRSTYCFLGGGQTNVVDTNSDYSSIVGGLSNQISGVDYAFIGGGYQGVATLQAQQVYSGGAFSTAGDAQAHELIWRRLVTGTTITELFLDGASVAAILPATNCLWQGTIEIAAICTVVGNGTTTLGDAQGTSYKVTIKRLGATTALVGTVQEIGTTNADPSALGVFTIDANDTNESLRIQFTPPPSAGSTTVHRVVATFRGLQIQY